MTAPVGFLDFFVLEASDYIEQLDAQLQAGGANGPDADAMQRVARALRGSATMAKLPVFADVAGGVERVGRLLREGGLKWDSALGGVLVAAVDDCKLLLRNVRTWSPSDEARARARVDELTRYAPLRPATPLASPTTTGHDSYLATESANIGAGLELLATRPSDRDAAANVLRRVRALRGIASVKDHSSLAEVLEAAESAAHPLELGATLLGAERVALLSAAATLLRAIATSIRTGRPLDPASVEISRFESALDAMQERESGTERVVPISELFYQDGGSTVVETAANPPTSPAERFRLEVVSQGEHLQRLVSDAREARDGPSRDRVRRELRQALRALRQAAESFGERDVAAFIAAHNDSVVQLDTRALDSIGGLAALLAQPGSAADSLGDRLRALQVLRGGTPPSVAVPRPPAPPAPSHVPIVAPAIVSGGPSPSTVMTPITSTPTVAPPTTEPQQRDRPAAAAVANAATAATAATTARRRPATPSTPALGALLDRGIRTLDTLPRTPLSTPVALPEQPPVPIEALLYRGQAAIERAKELRDGVRESGRAPDAEMLAELFDLIDLALTD